MHFDDKMLACLYHLMILIVFYSILLIHIFCSLVSFFTLKSSCVMLCMDYKEEKKKKLIAMILYYCPYIGI